MVFRLSIVTSLLALFAISFSALVDADRRVHEGPAFASHGCYDQGAVCVR